MRRLRRNKLNEKKNVPLKKLESGGYTKIERVVTLNEAMHKLRNNVEEFNRNLCNNNICNLD